MGLEPIRLTAADFLTTIAFATYSVVCGLDYVFYYVSRWVYSLYAFTVKITDLARRYH